MSRPALRLRRALALAVLVAPLAAGPAAGGGFQLFQQGAKASGRGNAFLAGADDASAACYNPAAAARLDGWNVSLGASTVRSDTVFDPPRFDPVSMQPVAAYPYTVYLTGRVGAYGFAVGTWEPYSLRTHWWATDPVASSSLKASWTSRQYSASVAAPLDPDWSMAIGLDYIRLRIDDLSRVEGLGLQSNVTMDGGKAGASLSFLYRPAARKVRFGILFRTQNIVRMEGVQRIETDGGGPPLSEVPVGANVVLPATFQVGVGEDGRGPWDWEATIQYAKWSKFDALDIEGLNSALWIHQREDWQDTFSFFGGFEYHFSSRHSARGGVIVDPTPIADDLARPYNPDSDKTAVTVGYGFRSAGGRYQVDAYAQLFVTKERSPAAAPSEGVIAGTYDTRSWASGLSFQYRF